MFNNPVIGRVGIALYDFEDRIIRMEEVPEGNTLTVRLGDRELSLERGLILFRTLEGNIRVAGHQDLNARRLLVFANRHCTRWIRLDI